MSTKKLDVLFLCTGNSCRSIMAEGLLTHHGSKYFNSYSAGSSPNGVIHPLSINTLMEKGIKTDDFYSKSWDEFKDKNIDIVITVCNNAANESCPIFPSNIIKANWPVEDPASFKGNQIEIIHKFSAICQDLENKIKHLVNLPFYNLKDIDLKKELDNIGNSY